MPRLACRGRCGVLLMVDVVGREVRPVLSATRSVGRCPAEEPDTVNDALCDRVGPDGASLRHS